MLYICTYVQVNTGMYICTYLCDRIRAMGKKRLVIDLEESDHSTLVAKARQADLTVSNYVRKALRLPLEKQGIKRKRLGKGDG